MPSTKQIIAEIQLTQTLGPNQKVFVVAAIRDAEQRLNLKNFNSRPPQSGYHRRKPCRKNQP